MLKRGGEMCNRGNIGKEIEYKSTENWNFVQKIH